MAETSEGTRAPGDARTGSRKDSAAAFVVGLGAGLAIWGMSPSWFGRQEPWDGVAYWIVALLVGFTTVLITVTDLDIRSSIRWHLRAAAGPIAFLVGQLLWIYVVVVPALPSSNPVILPPIVTVPLFSGPVVAVGAFLPYIAKLAMVGAFDAGGLRRSGTREPSGRDGPA